MVLSRTAVPEQVRDVPGSGDDRIVDVHVQRLRHKIGQEHIVTVRGFGYRFEP